MQTRTILGAGALLGVGALAVTQLSFQSQDRQYKKTLAYMHDGREKIQERMNAMANTADTDGRGRRKEREFIREQREGVGNVEVFNNLPEIGSGSERATTGQPSVRAEDVLRKEKASITPP
ncbi:hypothetical protein CLCR_07751 [Cladophialophora carrionii]|uniref:Uncharacterized protein n=1 Tax=Cladophialophora carrionii TaxID=86049 RepID=A0A1C1CMX4_9EURO|nr:hypothetical protein CLCR_07751 [Cladophialophora carrionii]